VLRILLSFFILQATYAADKDLINLKAAKYIAQIESSMRRSKVNSHILKRARKHLKRSKLFNHYVTDIDEILSIKNSLRKKRYFNCTKNPYGKNKVNKNFKRHLYNYCMSAYTLMVNKKFEKELLKNHKDYDKAILYFVKNNSRSFLKKLDRLDKNSKLYIYSKAQIITSILENGITPNKNLYGHIDFNSGLTYLLQSRLHSIKRNKLIFTQEFVKLYQEYKKVIHKNDIKNGVILAEQLLSFHQENKKYIYKKTAWKRLVIAGKKLLRRDQDSTARKVFKHTISLSYDFESYNESVFQLLWTSLHKQDYKSSLKDIEKLRLIDQFPKLSSKVKFWIAFSLHNDGDNSIASHLFKLIIKNNPLSYYSIISQKYLPTYNAKESRNLYLKKRNIASENITFKDLGAAHLRDIREFFIWKKLNYISKTDLLLEDFIKISPKEMLTNKELLSDYDKEELNNLKFKFFMNLFKSNKDFLSSFKFISKSIDRNVVSSSMININNLFPTLYSDIISKYNNGLDLNFVLSLIRQESAFNTQAKSSVGARGLMQLMPATAKRLVKYRRKDDLYEPSLNIKAGTKYLKGLLNNYDGNMVLALSSYNAGPSKVRHWMKTIFSSTDPIHMIEEIPYRETRLYVKLIYRNLFFYSLLNNKYLLDDSLVNTFKITLNKGTKR